MAVIQSHLSLKVQTSYILAVPLNVFSGSFDFLVIWVAGIRVVLQQTKRSVWAIKNFCILNPHKVLEDTKHFIRQLGYQGESAASWALCKYFFFTNDSNSNWSNPCLRKQLKSYGTHIENNSTKPVRCSVLC